MVKSLVNIALLVAKTTLASPPGLYRKFVFLGQSTEPIFTEGVLCTLRRVLMQSHLIFI